MVSIYGLFGVLTVILYPCFIYALSMPLLWGCPEVPDFWGGFWEFGIHGIQISVPQKGGRDWFWEQRSI